MLFSSFGRVDRWGRSFFTVICVLYVYFICCTPSECEKLPFDAVRQSKGFVPAAIAYRGQAAYAIDWRSPANYGKIFVLGSDFTIKSIVDFRSLISKTVREWRFPKEQKFSGIGGIEFDKDGSGVLVYPVAAPHFERNHFLILRSLDGWKSAEIAVMRGYPILQHKNGADLDSIMLLTMYWRAEVPGAEWGGVQDLFIEGPINHEKKKGYFRTQIANDCMGFSVHSGGNSAIVNYGDQHYVAYLGTPQGNCKNPVWVVTINSKGVVLGRDYLGCAKADKPDSHASPVLVLDDSNRLHVIIGSHGDNFVHFISAPLSKPHLQWQVGKLLTGRLTYAEIVKLENGNLLLSYRKWFNRDGSPTPIPSLTVREFSVRAQQWRPEVDLVIPSSPFEGYGIFFNHTILGPVNELILIYRFKDEYHKIRRAGGILTSSNGREWRRIDINSTLRSGPSIIALLSQGSK